MWFAVLSVQMPDKKTIKKPGNNSQSFAVGDWLVQPDIDQISTTSQTIYLRPQLMEVLDSRVIGLRCGVQMVLVGSLQRSGKH